MGNRSQSGGMDHEQLDRWVASQRGLVTRAQCLALGATPKFLRHRIATGRWVAPYPGVYLTVPGRDDWLTRAGAAVLACGPGAALSHDSALVTYGLRRPQTPIVVSIPNSRAVTRRDGIRVVRRSALAVPDETSWPPRTRVEAALLDVAAESDADTAIALVAEACRLEVTWDDAIVRALLARGRHRWRRLLLEALGTVGEGAQSVFEVRYVREVERAHGLPTSRLQQPSGGGRRHHDAGYPDQQVLVELDGERWHSAPSRRRTDDRRDLASLVEGWVTVRAGWADVAVTPCAFASAVGRLLQARGWTGAPRPCRRSTCSLRPPGDGR